MRGPQACGPATRSPQKLWNRFRILEDVISGRNFERPGLKGLLDYARPGDVLCLVCLDRLRLSLQELLETVEELKIKVSAPCLWNTASTPRSSFVGYLVEDVRVINHPAHKGTIPRCTASRHKALLKQRSPVGIQIL